SGRFDFHFAADQVHVGDDAEQGDIDGKRDADVARVVCIAGGDVDLTRGEHEAGEDLYDGFFLKVDRDGRLVLVFAAVGVVVHLEDDVGVLADEPADAVGQKRGRGAWGPATQRSGGDETGSAKALVARRGVGGVQGAGRAC